MYIFRVRYRIIYILCCRMILNFFFILFKYSCETFSDQNNLIRKGHVFIILLLFKLPFLCLY